ncbi:DgyrCDS2893 [Dimorphilus gyrociliatus]|uniref:DgyrCDS2893 n=1 Tax=Dimorphilus gyrociliatus TaxID=2664684 RepID=A0A7I8VEM1_9ANNE|nr:DgyrCDS2893 [Dimorphilus gyrociliatus]
MTFLSCSLYACLLLLNSILSEHAGKCPTAEKDFECYSPKYCLNDNNCNSNEKCCNTSNCGTICLNAETGIRDVSKCEDCTLQDCPYGLSTVREDNGCLKCECKYCPECFMNCEFGFEMKSDGCPDCKCRNNPCKTAVCPDEEKCVVVKPEAAEIPLYPYAKCEHYVLDDCFIPVKKIPGIGKNTGFYHYDMSANECKQISFNFQENFNVFKTKNICEKTCTIQKPCPPMDCSYPCKVNTQHECPTCECPNTKFRLCSDLICQNLCPAGFKIDQYGCETCQCKEQSMPDKCYLAAEMGRCEAAMKRYYYNKNDKTCYPFTYGGCGGNGNNFKTISECFDSCVESPCAIPMCTEECEFGRVLSKEGCETCKCADKYYCENVECAKNFVCVAQDLCADAHNCRTSFQCHPVGTVTPFKPATHRRTSYCGFNAIGTLVGFIVAMVLAFTLIVFGVFVIIFKSKFIQKSKICIRSAEEKPKINGRNCYCIIDNNAIVTPTEEKKISIA